MPQEPAIIDTTVIQVKSTTKDTYGNLVVTPVEGEDVKISAKRAQLFDVFQQGNTVKLFWAEYMHRKYIVRAELEGAPPPHLLATPPPRDGVAAIAPQEKGLWWKELGECLRSGYIDKTTPEGKFLRLAYFVEMFRVTGISLKDIKEEKSLQ